VPLPLPPPPKLDKPLGAGSTECHSNENSTAILVDNKVAALRAYRKATGLCQFCAEKWARGHKCAPTVQLQAVQELWDVLSVDSEERCTEDHSDTEARVLMVLSQEVVSAGSSPKTLNFQGEIQGTPVVILVDSGSSHSFVNLSLAPLLSGLSPVLRSLQVQVANGQIIKCDTELQQACWSIQNLNFVTDLKFLPLPYYGMILGIDWLEAHSPMKVD
jgi:hypothetical protein